MSDDATDRSGFEPELGGGLRESVDDQRSGFEPELGGMVRQKGVYVDEDGDSGDLVQEAIDTCPVDCIHWVNYVELTELEAERQHQVLKPVGFPVEQQVTFKRPPRKVRQRS
jgi:ferredoxin